MRHLTGGRIEGDVFGAIEGDMRKPWLRVFGKKGFGFGLFMVVCVFCAFWRQPLAALAICTRHLIAYVLVKILQAPLR